MIAATEVEIKVAGKAVMRASLRSAKLHPPGIDCLHEAAVANNNAIVRIESGLLSGQFSADGIVRAFKGVPYAKPPIGELRWRAPAPSVPWDGVRNARQFGPRCLQPSRLPTSIQYFGPEAEGEDCLYLNVWTAARSSDERRPVMVWIHGGAFYLGSAAQPIFDGERLARKGVVIVTVNYRLGRLGFLAHPELSAESDQGVSGNYGWLDLIAALRWVQGNIGAFGGDPGCVTIFGQSVGATTVCAFMTSPLTRGLFHRAIGQSGAALSAPGDTDGGSMLRLEAAEQAGRDFAKGLGANSIDELRGKSAEQIQLVRPEAGWTIKAVMDPSEPGPVRRETAWPTIDGHILPEPPIDAFTRDAQIDVPLLTGSTTSEGALFAGAPSLAAFREEARGERGESAPTFLELYPASSDKDAAAASKAARGDRLFVAQNWTWARLHARTGRANAFYYCFDRVPPAPELKDIGAFHTADIPYVFQTFDAYERWPWQPWDYRLSDTMSSFWVNFARAGDPNGAGLPAWPSFNVHREATVRFADDIGITSVPNRQRLAFWAA
jgi:para-nitrobenzyl esterase